MHRCKKNFLLLGIFIILIFCLSSCGAYVKTELNIDDSFSGNRKIVCTVNKNDVKDNFKGGVKKIDEILKNKCPSDLTYTKSEDATQYIYTFNLPFASKDDYEAKLERILMRKPNVYFSTSDTPFVKGIRISEDFNSLDILEWFKKVVEQEKLMDNLSNLWELGDTKVNYNGNNYVTSGEINLNKIEYYPINGILIYTQQSEYGTFYRDITFSIPDTTYQSASQEIEDYLSKRVPDGGNGEWSTTDNGKNYIITFHADSADELASKTSIVLDSNDNKACFIEDTPNSKAFKTQYILEETLNFSSFVSQNGNKVYVAYIYQPYDYDNIIFVQNEVNGSWQDVYYELNEGVVSFDDEINSWHIKVGVERKYPLSKVDIIMKQLDGNRFERKIVFEYDNNLDIEVAELAKKYIDGLSIPYTSTSTVYENETAKFVITITGDSEQITEAVKKLFGDNNNVIYIRQKGLFKVKKSTLMEDTINMQSLLQDSNYNNKINYTFITDGKEKINRLTLDSDGINIKTLEVNSSEFSEELSDDNVTIKYNGSVFNGMALFLILLIILLPIAILILVVVIFTKKASKQSEGEKVSYRDTIINIINSLKTKLYILFNKCLKLINNILNKIKNYANNLKNKKEKDNINDVANKINISQNLDKIDIKQVKNKLSVILKLLLFCAAIGFFFPMFTISCGNETNKLTFNGWTATFGTTVDTGFSSQRIEGNPLCMLLLLLPVISIIILVIKNKLSNLVKYIISLFSSASSIFILQILKNRVINEVKYSNYGIFNVKFEWGYKFMFIVNNIIVIISAIILYLILKENKTIKEKPNIDSYLSKSE